MNKKKRPSERKLLESNRRLCPKNSATLIKGLANYSFHYDFLATALYQDQSILKILINRSNLFILWLPLKLIIDAQFFSKINLLNTNFDPNFNKLLIKLMA